jgi:hypothetical protein
MTSVWRKYHKPTTRNTRMARGVITECAEAPLIEAQTQQPGRVQAHLQRRAERSNRLGARAPKPGVLGR